MKGSELCINCFYWLNYKKDKEYITKKCRCLKHKKPNLAQRAPFETITTTQSFEGKIQIFVGCSGPFYKVCTGISYKKQIGKICS